MPLNSKDKTDEKEKKQLFARVWKNIQNQLDDEITKLFFKVTSYLVSFILPLIIIKSFFPIECNTLIDYLKQL